MPRARRVLFFVVLSIAVSPLALAGEAIAPAVNPLMITPFVLLLLAIALMPFIDKRWWEKNYPYVVAALGFVTVFYYLVSLQSPERMLNVGMEYVSFIVLIGSLFVVAGGIHIRIKGKSTPITNVVILVIGAIISNVLGTTGASMILVRPYLRVNQYRVRGYHVVFFIIIVSNMGGALTPIGDPPLFLGYLKGVPFLWIAESLWHIWAVALAMVLLIFYLIDRKHFNDRESNRVEGAPDDFHEEAEVSGLHNVFFLGMILLAVFIRNPRFVREALMVVAAAGSFLMTRAEIHRKNDFHFGPLKEVAILFLGIFATMAPALDWLELNAGRIGIASPGQFYWGTGILSSVLDNAPTYLNFLSASFGTLVDNDVVRQVQHLVATRGSDLASIGGMHAEEIRNTFSTLVKYHGDLIAGGADIPVASIQVACLIGNHAVYLKAISIAAVFFGANTYIGNGPNFMVKSIAEQAGVKTPTFLDYIGRYALPMLVPIFALIWWLFFRT